MLPKQPPSIASSPTVLALRRPLAQALGWPQRTLGWRDLIGAFSDPRVWAKAGHTEWASRRVVITDPSNVDRRPRVAVDHLRPDPDRQGQRRAVDRRLGVYPDPRRCRPGHQCLLRRAEFLRYQRSERGGRRVPGPTLESDVANYDVTNPATALVPV